MLIKASFYYALTSLLRRLKIYLLRPMSLLSILFLGGILSLQSSMAASLHTSKIAISPQELHRVGELIYKNETGNKRENLAVWNVGENFPSLGIGHFIWFKQGEPEIFEETFPGLVEYLKKHGKKLPTLLRKYRYAPWKTREEFNAAKARGELDEVINFLYETKDIQALYIYERLQQALTKMKAVSQFPEYIEIKFYKVANSQNGLYALIDYVNFKGEGINPNERYNGYGWGLMQVLESMEIIYEYPTKTEQDAATLASFRKAATEVLTRRVNNADPAKNEGRWLPGWKNRIETYRP